MATSNEAVRSCYDFDPISTMTLPYPPESFRKLVSPVIDESYYDNPAGDYIWGLLDIGPLAPGEAYRRIFDFGCGCGREARRLLLQRKRPQSYVGLDINQPMIQWCQQNLSLEGFSFHHHDVWSLSYAPENSKNRTLPIAQLGSDFSLIEANSVFTHLYADQTEFYLREMYGMLSENGLVRFTIFFFNKKWFPMMSADHNTIFVDEKDPSQAVYYDWNYFRSLVTSLGYRVVNVKWTETPGFHNIVILAKSKEFPDIGNSGPPESVLGFPDRLGTGSSSWLKRIWRQLLS